MSDHHFELSGSQLARLGPFLSDKPRGMPRVDDRRLISEIISKELSMSSARADVEGCTGGLGPAQDALQPGRALVAGGRVRSDILGAGRRKLRDRHGDDRRHTSERALHRGEPGKKRDALRPTGRTKGGLNAASLGR